MMLGESFRMTSLVSATTLMTYSVSLRMPLAEVTHPSNSISAFWVPSEKPCISCSIESVCKVSFTSLPIIEPQVVNCISLISSSGALRRINSSLHGSSNCCVILNLSSVYLTPSSSILNCLDTAPLMLTDMFFTEIDITSILNDNVNGNDN